MQANTTCGEQELFCHCLDQPARERAEWLETACGDDEPLKRRIVRLLAAHDKAERMCWRE